MVNASEGQITRPKCQVQPMSATAARNRLTRYEKEIYNPALAEIRAAKASGRMDILDYHLQNALERVHRYVREKAVEAGEDSDH